MNKKVKANKIKQTSEHVIQSKQSRKSHSFTQLHDHEAQQQRCWYQLLLPQEPNHQNAPSQLKFSSSKDQVGKGSEQAHLTEICEG